MFIASLIVQPDDEAIWMMMTQTMLPTKSLKLGTRGSPLALAQANETNRRLTAAHDHPGNAADIIIIRTTGDMIQDRSLALAGGKGLFTKELDEALLRGDIDAGVHSAKDLPTALPPGIRLAGTLLREDVRDALICKIASQLRDLPQGARVGTASLRRAAQLRRLRPDLRTDLLRGNVETRLRKVESGEFDATLLALAGLNRLGLAHHATAVLDLEDFLPACGQGAVAITIREGDTQTQAILEPILHHATLQALEAERAFLRVLDGSCRTPIAGHAAISDGQLAFRGQVLSLDGAQTFEAHSRGAPADAASLGVMAGEDILARMPPDFLKI